MKIYNNVSHGQLSIARFYGGMKINGEQYKYDFANDALILVSDLKEYKKEVVNIEGAKKPRWNP